jgi:hypothetical protein
VGRLFVIRWTDLDLADLPRAQEQVTQAHGEVGRLIYVTVIAPYARVPNRAERQALSQFSESLYAMCEVVYLVLQGDSIRHMLQRTALTGIRLFLLNKTPTSVHKSMGEIVPDVARRLGRPPDEVRALFVERRLG